MKPNLNAKLSSENFKNYYFRKEELLDFCRREGLKVSGNKQDLVLRKLEVSLKKILVHSLNLK